MTDIVVPALGESVTEGTVASWMKQPGEAIAKNEPLVELETDKVTLEVPAPSAGILSEIVAGPGTTVEIGAVLGRIEAGAAASKPSASAAPAASSAASAAPSETKSAEATSGEAGSGAPMDVVVPAMGESVTEGSISEWRVIEGQAVKQDDPLVEIETDKVAVDVPAPRDGVITKIIAAAGQTVSVGAVIAQMTAGAGASASSADAPVAPASSAPPATSAATGANGARMMPSARRILAEGEIDPASVTGTGKGARITKADALGAAANPPAAASSTTALTARAPTTPADPRDVGAREERVRMTRLRQTIARRLKEAQNSAAMLTTFNDVDMTAVIEARKKYKVAFEKKHGVKLGFMGFFVKAVIQALKDVPAVNAEIDGDDIIYKNYYDVGVAVGTDRGLVVPVVRDADALTLGGIEAEIGELGRKARDGKLSMDDMQGATFTISNGGVYGSLLSTPILNAPQSGILGMHRIEERPVAVDGAVVVRPMMYLALSYDHRIVDGKEAVTFLVRVKECVEDPERLMLDL